MAEDQVSTQLRPGGHVDAKSSCGTAPVGGADPCILPGDEVGAVRSELGQVRQLLSCAISELTQSFTTLADDSKAQQSEVHTLLTGMSGELSASEGSGVTIHGFVAGTAELLQGLADLLVHFSKQSVSIAYRIDDMVRQMGAIFTLVEEVDSIAEDTNILAINAALEAVRAGELGKGFGVVASEVRALSRKTKGLNDAIVQRMHQAEGSISSVREAITDMSSHDMEKTLDAKAGLDHMVSRLEAMQHHVEASLVQLESFTATVHDSAAAAIRGLQFEDMVSQLLHDVDGRLNAIDVMVAEVSAIARDTADSDEVCARRLNGALRAYGDAVESLGRRAVEQSNMKEGDVELF